MFITVCILHWHQKLWWMKRFSETSGGGLSRIPPVGYSHGIGHIPQCSYEGYTPSPRRLQMSNVTYHSAGTKSAHIVAVQYCSVQLN